MAHRARRTLPIAEERGAVITGLRAGIGEERPTYRRHGLNEG